MGLPIAVMEELDWNRFGTKARMVTNDDESGQLARPKNVGDPQLGGLSRRSAHIFGGKARSVRTSIVSTYRAVVKDGYLEPIE